MLSRSVPSASFLLVTFLATHCCFAQEWADKMFKAKDHDFGTVVAGSEPKFEFVFQNLYKEDVHIQSVRSSCGCTSVSIKNPSLKSWEKGAIVAKFNTDRFRGNRSATITVSIDKPFRAEVQLKVKGNIRGDVTINPGAINFGEVKSLAPTQKTVRITKYGNVNWQIEDVKSTYRFVSVQLKQVHRGYDSVSYDMTISTKAQAPEGYIQSELLVVTNDRQNRQVPIVMTGKVVTALQMSPNVLTFGPLAPGETGTKRVLLKADKPFEINDVTCADSNFVVKAKSGAKKLHFIEVSYRGAEKVGEIKRSLSIKTDICEHPFQLPVVAEIANKDQ